MRSTTRRPAGLPLIRPSSANGRHPPTLRAPNTSTPHGVQGRPPSHRHPESPMSTGRIRPTFGADRPGRPKTEDGHSDTSSPSTPKVSRKLKAMGEPPIDEASSSSTGAEEVEKDIQIGDEVLGTYVVEEQLGSGSSGIIYLVRDKVHKMKYVLKSPKLTDTEHCSKAYNLQCIARETEILKKLHHPNIIRYHDDGMHKKHRVLITEYIEGDTLLTYCRQHKAGSEEAAFRILHQMLSALRYMHAEQVSHRDLKLENIMLTKTGAVKLIDFGMAIDCKRKDISIECCGSPHYMSPELLNYDKDSGPFNCCKADMWAFGVISYAVLLGALPFNSNNRVQLQKLIKNGSFYLPPTINESHKNYLTSLLVVDPVHRISAAQSMKTEYWIENCVALDLCMNGVEDKLNTLASRRASDSFPSVGFLEYTMSDTDISTPTRSFCPAPCRPSDDD